MRNLAIVSEITGNEGSNIIGRVNEGETYVLVLDHVGDHRFQVSLVDELTNKRILVINRLVGVTTGRYVYEFRAPADAIVHYDMAGAGKDQTRIRGKCYVRTLTPKSEYDATQL